MASLVRITLLALSLVLPPGIAAAQVNDSLQSDELSEELPEPAQVVLYMSNSMGANLKHLSRYTWQNRVELMSGDRTLLAFVNQIRFGEDGKPETERISEEPEARDKKARKKQIKLKRKIVEQAARYSRPSMKDLAEFFEEATFALGEGDMAEYIQVQGQNLVQKHDSVTMWIDKITYLPYKTEFHTKLDGGVMKGDVSFDYVSGGGPFYMARSVIDLPDKNMQTIIENLDFEVAR
jgi:hypothetical protein